jgi:hypothetical protein
MNQSGHINAALQARLDAGARHERTLEAVSSPAVFGAGTPRRQDGLFPARLPTGTQAVCDDRRSSAPTGHGPQLCPVWPRRRDGFPYVVATATSRWAVSSYGVPARLP